MNTRGLLEILFMSRKLHKSLAHRLASLTLLVGAGLTVGLCLWVPTLRAEVRPQVGVSLLQPLQLGLEWHPSASLPAFFAQGGGIALPLHHGARKISTLSFEIGARFHAWTFGRAKTWLARGSLHPSSENAPTQRAPAARLDSTETSRETSTNVLFFSPLLGYRTFSASADLSSIRLDGVSIASSGAVTIGSLYAGFSIGADFAITKSLRYGFDLGLQLPLVGNGSMEIVDTPGGNATTVTSRGLTHIGEIVLPQLTLIRLSYVWP